MSYMMKSYMMISYMVISYMMISYMMIHMVPYVDLLGHHRFFDHLHMHPANVWHGVRGTPICPTAPIPSE